MTNKITDKEIIFAIVKNIGLSESDVKKVYITIFEQILNNLEQSNTVSIKNFGTFYIKGTTPTRTFKFNPSQNMRRFLGWSVKQ